MDNDDKFDDLRKDMPDMKALELDVQRITSFLMMEDPRPTTAADTQLIWAVLIKPRLEGLVGWWGRVDIPTIAGTSQSYEAAVTYLNRALVPSDESLGEESKAEDYDRNYREAMHDWDGEEETRPDFISTEKIIQILVSRLDLPVPEGYERFIGSA